MSKQDIPPIDIQRYSYHLPADRIAAYPLDERDASKLLRFSASDGTCEHHHFRDLARLLPERSLLVVNSTKVIAARLVLSKPTGGRVEVLLIDPVAPSRDPALTLQATARSTWNCMIGGRNVHPGMELTHDHADLSVVVQERSGTGAVVELRWRGTSTLATLLEQIGRLPLPPYIQREVEQVDADRYQTVYADQQGSVAAPTAGLHFTQRVFDGVRQRNIATSMLTLHVGLGTFQPVTADDARDHAMHTERFGVTRQTIDRLADQAASDQPWTTVVGTTSLRTLESLFHVGAQLASGVKLSPDEIRVDQWAAFDRSTYNVDRRASFESLRGWMDRHELSSIWGTTSIMLAPGCRIATADALITNFHQPGNTLMLLVAAFVGEDQWKRLYDEALANDYRFLSYGDSSLLIR